jgi:hypothetical protein
MTASLAAWYAKRIFLQRAIVWMVLGGAMLFNAAFSPVAAQEETEPDSVWYLVADGANLLDEGQEESAVADTRRLNEVGIPAQVATELVVSTPEEAQLRADQIRLQQAIESSPGADDGIVVYAAVNPYDRSRVFVAISVGANALPHGGLTRADIDDIVSTIVVPQLTSGHPARAIVFSIRDMIYRDLYTPPAGEPLAGRVRTMHDVITWGAPVVAIVAVGIASRRIGKVSTFRQAAVLLAPLLLGAIGLAVVAATGRSAVAAFSAIGLFGASVVMAVIIDRSLQGNGRRSVSVSPRPPGTFAARGAGK